MIIKLQEEIRSRQSLYNSFNLILIIKLPTIQLRKSSTKKKTFMYMDYMW
jgi:hypothetical protein